MHQNNQTGAGEQCNKDREWMTEDGGRRQYPYGGAAESFSTTDQDILQLTLALLYDSSMCLCHLMSSSSTIRQREREREKEIEKQI